MIKLCIFDMDGLLIDSERGMWLVNEKRSIEELGFIFNEQFIRSLMGSSMSEYKIKIVEYYGPSFPIEQYYEMVFKYNEVMIQNNQLKLMKGVKELLDFLKQNNIKMRIATSTPLKNALEMLDKLNIKEYFEEVVSGQDVKRGKPYPDVYLKALDKYNKEDALIFEDGHNGAIAALSSGIKLILVPDIAYLSNDDKNNAFKVIDNLSLAIKIISDINKI